MRLEEHLPIKPFIDGVSLSTMLATLLGWLPALAALLSVVWTAIRIYETETVKKLIDKCSTR